MKKAVAIICTIVIFVFSLIGCGDKDDESGIITE